ncbi:MAG TPA: SseB family protein [Streptosporangiaceae bacterium]|jgi:hypothetical protein|nr:SseB family protein [Streptosporangiaceae bacterium]
MSIATNSNTATPAPPAARPASDPGSDRGADPASDAAAAGAPAADGSPARGAVERALADAIADASRIGDLLDVLRTERLWLPLPDDGSPVITGTSVTLPTVSYLGSDFVPAYSSAELLAELTAPPAARGAADESTGRPGEPRPVVPHAVVRAADLARLLPPSVGIALNAGATQSVPVYPQGVSYLAAENTGSDLDRITVGPLPVRPDGLLADIAAGLIQIAAVRDASAAWLSVQFAGEGLLISVTLDEPADAAVRDIVAGAIERAAWQAAPQDAGFPMDVTFPGEAAPDRIDEWIAAFATPFYRRD